MPHGGDDFVRAVGDRGLANHERHRPAPSGLLVDVDDLGPAQIGLAGLQRAEQLELLLAVQDPRNIGAQVAEHRAGVGRLVAERDRERRRRDQIAPLGGRSDPVVEIERVEVADRPRELLDLPALHRDRVGGILLADQGLADRDRHRHRPLLMARARNFSMSGTTARSCRPSAILSFSSHASTANRKRRPSLCKSVAFARTFIPTGVAARCFMSTVVPTVPAPGGRWGLRTAPAASSSLPMTNGVAKTCTPRLPIACAVCSAPTVQVTSAVAPSPMSMGPGFTVETEGTASGVSSYAR